MSKTDTPPPEEDDANDDLTPIENAVSRAEDAPDRISQAIDDAVAGAEQKLDTFLGNVDRFLGKM